MISMRCWEDTGKHFGESDCLKVLIRLKREEGLGQHEEDWTDEIGDYNSAGIVCRGDCKGGSGILFTNERK